MSIEAMKQALEALKIAQNNLAPSKGSAHSFGDGELWDFYEDAATSLRLAIATEEYSATQEPVAWISWNRVSGKSELNYHKVASQHDATLWSHFPLYRHPQPKAGETK